MRHQVFRGADGDGGGSERLTHDRRTDSRIIDTSLCCQLDETHICRQDVCMDGVRGWNDGRIWYVVAMNNFPCWRVFMDYADTNKARQQCVMDLQMMNCKTCIYTDTYMT